MPASRSSSGRAEGYQIHGWFLRPTPLFTELECDRAPFKKSYLIVTQPVVLKCLGLLVLWMVAWGVTGYFMGGWETSRTLGLIAGPIFALCFAIPVILKARKTSR